MFSSLKTTFYRCEVDTSHKNDYFVFRDGIINARIVQLSSALKPASGAPRIFRHFPKKKTPLIWLFVASLTGFPLDKDRFDWIAMRVMQTRLFPITKDCRYYLQLERFFIQALSPSKI